MMPAFERCGPVGSGSTMKLAVNLPFIVFWEAFGEAMALPKPLSIGPARLVDLLGKTVSGANVLKNRAPLVAKALAGEDTGPVTFDLDAMCKDLHTVIEEARSRVFRLTSSIEAECNKLASQISLPSLRQRMRRA